MIAAKALVLGGAVASAVLAYQLVAFAGLVLGHNALLFVGALVPASLAVAWLDGRGRPGVRF